MPDMQVLPPDQLPLADARALVGHWFRAARPVVSPLAAVGFSGSPLFRVEAGGATYVLKAFPSGTTPGRVAFVHAAVGHIRSQGVGEVPAVRPTLSGETCVEDDRGHSWELQDFVPGESTAHPTADQAAAALAVLARLHLAAATLPENPPDRGPSPGIARRIEQARGMLSRPWGRLEASARSDQLLAARLAGFRDRAAAFVESGMGGDTVAAVAALEPAVLSRQTVLRDLWAPHVLFAAATSTRVMGVVDCHAMGIDTPATDVARLLGSWAVEVGFEAGGAWEAGLAAYETIRPLPPAECRLVPFLAASGVVFGLDNWFRWIFEQGRRFSNHAAVAMRVERLTQALPTALDTLRRTLPASRV